MTPAARAEDPHRAQVLKRAVFALLLLGVFASTLLILRLLGQGFARVTDVQEQASGLNLSRRPEATLPLRWLPDAADVSDESSTGLSTGLDGVTREDIRVAYLLAHAELTYARRSGDPSGLPGLFSGDALRGAQSAGAGLLLDWGHRARVLSVQLQPAPLTPLRPAGESPHAVQVHGGRVSLHDDYWVATARAGSAGWIDVQVRRRRVEAQLQRTDGRWRLTALRPLAQTTPQPGPPPPVDLAAWRAVTLPAEWPGWSPATWQRRLEHVRRAGLGPLRAPLPARPTRADLRALAAALAHTRAAGVGLVPAFGTPLRVEALPLRAQVATLLAPGTLAFDPGAVDPADPGSRAALLALRLMAPGVPLVAEVSGGLPDGESAGTLGLSATVTADPERAASDPETLLTLPGAARWPWARGAADTALDSAAARGRWLGRLDDLLGPDGQPSERGERVLQTEPR